MEKLTQKKEKAGFVLNDYCIFIDDINSHTVEIILNDGENPQILLEKT